PDRAPGPGPPHAAKFSNSWVPSMNDVTRILSAIEQGDPHAASQLLPLVYDELRRLAALKMAQEKPGQTRKSWNLLVFGLSAVLLSVVVISCRHSLDNRSD